MQVQLISAGPRKIEVIKIVREATNWGLKEAKQWVDGAPSSALEIGAEHADALALALRNAGATVDVSGGAAAAAPPASAASADGGRSVSDELEELASLHDRGILTDDEFAAAKARLLGIS